MISKNDAVATAILAANDAAFGGQRGATFNGMPLFPMPAWATFGVCAHCLGEVIGEAVWCESCAEQAERIKRGGKSE